MEVKRGDIFFADLSPVVGHEQAGIRPILVLQNDLGNAYSGTIIVAAITSKIKGNFPTHVKAGPNAGIHRDSIILLEQVRTIDTSRLRGSRVGRISQETMERVEAALDISFGRETKAKEVDNLDKLKIINHDGRFTVDSRAVADMIEKDHAHLLRDIKGYAETLDNGENPRLDSLNFFIPHAYSVEGNNKIYPCYLLTRKGCDMVANKMTGEKGILFTAEYVTRFEEMEKSIKSVSSLEALQQTVKVLSEHENRINQLDDKVNNQITVTYFQAKEIQFAVAGRVIELLGGKGSLDYKELKGSYFQQLHHDLKDRLGVPSYRDIRKIDYDAALAYIKAWLPKASERPA